MLEFILEFLIEIVFALFLLHVIKYLTIKIFQIKQGVKTWIPQNLTQKIKNLKLQSKFQMIKEKWKESKMKYQKKKVV